MVYKLAWQKAVDYLFPTRCLLTQQAIPADAHNRFISSNAQRFLPILNNPCCRCGLPLHVQTHNHCGNCQQNLPHYQQVICPLMYAEPISSMLQAAKFKNKLHYSAFFADVLLQAIQQRYQTHNLPKLILPVPLDLKRLQQRGYNQSREISRLLSQKLCITHNDSSLIRIKATYEQSNLDATQRRHNVKNAFALADNLIPVKHVAVVDDVMTTGATVNSIAKTLIKEGVEQVDIWVVARTAKQRHTCR